MFFIDLTQNFSCNRLNIIKFVIYGSELIDELEIEESMQSEEKDLKDELLKTEEESRTLV